MPIYEYKCNSCGTVFEKLRKFSDPPLTICDCGKTGTVERLLSSPAFHLKGGGWYKDGYAGSAPAKSGNGESKTSDTKTAESKTESKPESKAAPPPSSTTSSSTSTSSDSK